MTNRFLDILESKPFKVAKKGDNVIITSAKSKFDGKRGVFVSSDHKSKMIIDIHGTKYEFDWDEVRLDEGIYSPMGDTPGFPVFHTERGMYRKSNKSTLNLEIKTRAEEIWTDYTFIVQVLSSRIRVGVYLLDQEVDWFVLSNRSLEKIEVIESPEGVFEEHLDDFINIVNIAIN